MSNAQLITTMVEGNVKEVADELEMTKGVITEEKSGGNTFITEDPETASYVL